jgi:hypothetical protein
MARKSHGVGGLVQPDTPAAAVPAERLARVEIRLDSHDRSQTRVIINGQDMTRLVQSLTIDAPNHSLPGVTLRLIPRELVVISDEAIVQPSCVKCGAELQNMTACATVRGVIADPAGSEPEEDEAPF